MVTKITHYLCTLAFSITSWAWPYACGGRASAVTDGGLLVPLAPNRRVVLCPAAVGLASRSSQGGSSFVPSQVWALLPARGLLGTAADVQRKWSNRTCAAWEDNLPAHLWEERATAISQASLHMIAETDANSSAGGRTKGGSSPMLIALNLASLGLLAAYLCHLRHVTRLARQVQEKDAQLGQTEHNYRELLDNALVGIYITQNHILKYCNRAFAQLLGYAYPGEIIGASVQKLVAEDSWATVDREVRLRERGRKKASHYRFKVVRKDGAIREVEVIGCRILYQGKPAIQGTMVDITARVESERIKAVFAGLAEALSGVGTAEEAGRIILQAADHLLGWDASLMAICPDRERMRLVVAYDLLDGRRVEVDPATLSASPTAMITRVMEQGARLILRRGQDTDHQELIPFGDAGRRSASLMFVPIRKEGTCVGALSIQSYRPGAYSADHLQLLQALADHCGTALLRLAAQEALRESEQRLRNLFENALVGIYRTTPDGRVLFANPALVRMLGFKSTDELLAQNLERESPQHRYPRDEFKRLIETQGRVIGLETSWTRPDGTVVYLRESGVAVKDQNGVVQYYEGSVEDITERCLAQQALERSEREYRQLYDLAPVGYHELDCQGRVVRVNRTEADLLGYTVEEMVGKPIWEFIAAEEREEAQCSLARKLAGELPPLGTERTYVCKDGRRLQIHVADRLVRDASGRVVAIRSTVQDVTPLNRAERALRASLHEKEMLLKEVHHRVKNNMQVVSSLLSLQASAAHEPIVQALLRDSQNRVKTMALIHEQLYQAENLARIDFAHFLRCLTTGLVESYGLQRGRVKVQIEADSVWLGVDTAIPCGLIVNELVTNSLKHAFPDNRKGTIRVTMRRDGGQVVLCVADNGVGLPAGFDLHTTESLGLQLVMTLVDQVEGSLTLCNQENGVKFCLAFPESEFGDGAAQVPAPWVEVVEVGDGNGRP